MSGIYYPIINSFIGGPHQEGTMLYNTAESRELNRAKIYS